MDCNEARPLLGAALDRELSAAEALRVETHVAQCAQCRHETQMLKAVSDATRTADYFRAPDALRARILAALPATPPAAQDRSPDEARRGQSSGQTRETPARSRGRGLWDWVRDAWRTPGRAPLSAGGRGFASALAWPTGIAVAAIALAASVALVVHRPQGASATFVDELVASHVRAQLSGHDIDVVSSDQHTVKPWFNGRIDYAPPVEDLAAEGFALTGGRLDYIGHRRVAVLVYRYRKHIIDVYVMPQAAAAAREASAALTSDGYALASWQDQGMLWWAVGDAEPAVLMRLRQALTARLSRPAKVDAG